MLLVLLVIVGEIATGRFGNGVDALGACSSPFF